MHGFNVSIYVSEVHFLIFSCHVLLLSDYKYCYPWPIVLGATLSAICWYRSVLYRQSK